MPQSLSKVFLHTVFSTKYRRNQILPEIEDELYAYIGGIILNAGGIPININGMPDHIHILSTLPRTITIAKYVQLIKQYSSRWIKTKGAKFNDFRWQDGYATFSVDRYRVDIVDRYIRNQKEHHRKKAFERELLEYLEYYEVEYDERYLWD